jgi:hypothetical protein
LLSPSDWVKSGKSNAGQAEMRASIKSTKEWLAQQSRRARGGSLVRLEEAGDGDGWLPRRSGIWDSRRTGCLPSTGLHEPLAGRGFQKLSIPLYWEAYVV